MRKWIAALLAAALAFSWSSAARAEGDLPVKVDLKAKAYTELKTAAGGQLNFFEKDGQFFLSGKLSAAQKPGVSAAEKFLDTYKALFGIKSVALELKASAPEKDATGDTFVRFTQLISGVEVYGSLVNVHFDKDGTIVSVNGRVLQDKRIANLGSLRVTQSSAVGIAKKQFTYEKLRDDLQPTEKVIITKDGKNYIVYRVNIAFEQPTIGNYNVNVESTSGKIVSTENKIRYDNAATGTGIGVGGAVKDLALTYSDNIDGNGNAGYGMLDETNPATEAIITYEYLFYNPPGVEESVLEDDDTADEDEDFMAYLVTDASNHFTSEQDKASVSAHYFADVVLDFYKNMFNRKSLDDEGMPIISATHYGMNYNNAFWSGYVMFYGDGNGTDYTYFSGDLDLVGHEMTHGVIDYTAQLIYADEPGALNESFADVFGVMIETYDKYGVANGGEWKFDPADWVFGDDIYTPDIVGDAMRSLADPHNGKADGDYLNDWQPEHMSEYVYTDLDYGGVHTNSGIPNKAAFRVAEALGMEKTARIYYRALSQYMYEYTTFAEAMECLMISAEDLYGWYSDEAIAVRNAYMSVGVELPIYDPYEPNNYPECAGLLWPFENTSSYITSLNDDDYYVLYADHRGKYTVNLTGIPANCNYNLYLLNDREMELASSGQAGNRPESISITLDEGIYFIGVIPVREGDGFSKKQPYTLRLNQDSLAAPAASARTASYNSVKIAWGWVLGATNFEIYRATASGGPYTKIATLPESSGSYTNTGLATNTVYYYKVRAIRTSPALGAYSPVVSARPMPAAPATFGAASASYNSIRVSWSAVAGASGYELYRATSSSGAYTRIFSGTALSYTNASLSTGGAYYYKVRAYRTVGSTKAYGPFTAVKYASPTLGVPASVKAARASSTSIKATWGKVSGASGYELWRSTASNGTYSLVKATTSLYYTNTRLATGRYYFYKVRAYRVVGSKKVYSAFSGAVSAKP